MQLLQTVCGHTECAPKRPSLARRAPGCPSQPPPVLACPWRPCAWGGRAVALLALRGDYLARVGRGWPGSHQASCAALGWLARPSPCVSLPSHLVASPWPAPLLLPRGAADIKSAFLKKR